MRNLIKIVEALNPALLTYRPNVRIYDIEWDGNIDDEGVEMEQPELPAEIVIQNDDLAQYFHEPNLDMRALYNDRDSNSDFYELINDYVTDKYGFYTRGYNVEIQ
jgi:hypothetical protein